MSRQKKVIAAFALLCVGVLLGGLLHQEASAPAERPVAGSASVRPLPAGPEPGPEQPPTLFPRVPRKGPAGELEPPIARLPPPRAPVIDEIALDKTSVCFNEDVTVTVKAHTPGGLDDPFLRYRVAGEEGPVVPLRRLAVSRRGGLPERGGYRVSVTGRGGTHVTVPLPEIDVKDCRLPEELELVHSLEPGADGLVRFVASPIGYNPDLDSVSRQGSESPPRFQPVKYRWSFGDGTTEETLEGTVLHDFGARPQEARYSYFLVRCEAVDGEGRTLVASRAVELRNPVFDAFVEKGRVRLLARTLPAEVGRDGQVIVPVRLWHQWPVPITVKSVKLRRHRGSELLVADARHPPSRPAEEELFVALALGVSRIPREGIIVRVGFDPEGDRDVAARELRLEGETPEGWPVTGGFIAIRPEVDPVVRRMLVEGEWRAKVLRARAHLNRADVSEKEIMDLEGAGLFLELPRAFRGTPPPGFEPPEPVASPEEG